MKQILLSAACVLWAALAAGQVGNGVLFLTEPTIAFPATTVDSTSTIELEIVNDLAIDQTVLFSVIDAPFSLVDNTPITIAGDDTASVVLQFQPTTTGLFTGELEALGSVFGSATISFSGEGIQVVLDWTPESLTFDTTAIMQTSTADIVFENVGNGTAEIEAINDPSGHFTVEFIDTYVAPVVEECFEYNNTIFYNYYLTVDLGSDPSNTYWYIQDNYGFNGWGSNYGESADSLEVCLPYDGSPTQQSIYVNFFNFGSGQDASMQLQDIYGNVVWSIELGAEDYYFEYSIDFLLPLGEAPVPPEFEPGIIAEGSSQTARISFTPSYAGDVYGEVQFLTNSPVNSVIQVPTFGVGISEIGGEVCDLVLDSANSPYFLVEDLEVTEGCSLTIEPGVEIIGEAYDIICFGSLNASGTQASPVTLSVGEIVSHSEQFEMHHCEIVEHSTSPGLASDLRIIRDESGVSTNSELAEFLSNYSTASLDADWYLENVSPHIELDLENEAVHFDNFTNTNSCGEWSSTNNDVTITCDGLIDAYHNYCGCWHSWELHSPVYSIPADRLNGFSKVQFDYTSSGSSSNGNYQHEFAYLIDGGEGDNNPGWQYFENWNSNYHKSGNYTYELNSPEFETDFNEDGIITIQFYYYFYGVYQSRQTIDNFQLSSGPLEDAEDFHEAAGAFENSISDNLGYLSTGNLSLHDCNVEGDIEVVGFANEVQIENCTLTGGQGGLAIYSDQVNMQVTNSTIIVQNFDGARVYSSTGDILIEESLLHGNAGNGIQLKGGLSFHLWGSEVFSNQENGISLTDIQDTELSHC
ncbi:right-handed parallel beta-helix repeat-containing protein, partial [bacterium]|nr:right-handed parallel beta-helix repeat-containing protein [bacterium]